MTNKIGELLLQNNIPLIKMWSIDVKPGKREFVNHSHTRFEITVVNKGFGEYKTEKKTYPMEPGDVFVFSSNEIHCITYVGEEGLSITNLHFEPRFLNENNVNEFNKNYINFCFSHSQEFENRIPADIAKTIKDNQDMIKNEFLNNQIEQDVAIKSYLNLILIDLLRNHKYSSLKSTEQNNIFNILSVYNYIDSHLSDNLTLNELSKVANLSPNYFSHIFKVLNGISLWEYITAKRLEKASHLLKNNPELTILDIALECGFNNTVNFNKYFKKQKGITPSNFRKSSKILLH